MYRFVALVAAVLTAQQISASAQSETAAPLPAASSGTKRAFIVCGHPGDVEHWALYGESVDRIRLALTSRFGFDDANVWVRFGTQDAGTGGPSTSRGPSTKEALAEDVKKLTSLTTEGDELWVFVLGHAHHADRVVQFNLPGADCSAEEFGEWFADVECRRAIFLVTTPLSGYFLKPLAAPGRVIISATERDLEVNETLFHASLAKVLETFPEGDAHDIDKDGVHSLLDLYLAVTLDVAARYAEEELLATEHGQLDDNGDGRGSELQLNYTVEEDSTIIPPARVIQVRPDRDGAVAKAIDLGSSVQDTPEQSTQQQTAEQ